MRTSYGWAANPGRAPTAGPPDSVASGPELADVGRLWRRAMRGLAATARADDGPSPTDVLAHHLGADAPRLPALEERWAAYDHVNLQRGVDAWLISRDWRLLGISGLDGPPAGLADLLAGSVHPHVRVGSVSRVAVPSGPAGATIDCVRCGLYLVTDGEQRTALVLRGPSQEWGRQAATLEIVSTDPTLAHRVGREIRTLALEHNVFRGRVIGFGGEIFGPESVLLQFHERPTLPADQLILDRSILESIERQVVEVSRQRARLTAAGQHLKRGLLLYGPPGVGKTHTVRYLMSTLVDTTVVLLAGNTLHLIGEACSVARALQPSMVVIEDVDLIAEDRGMHPGAHPVLFQLLNEMDGLAEDSDVVFVLTTNRADLLEPALAQRPGRVDHAVELGLPDLAARRALFELYRGAMRVSGDGVDGVLRRCDGVTASFIKELLRRAAVHAAIRSSAAVGDPQGRLGITTAQLSAALDELLDQRNAMTRVLLGGAGGGQVNSGLYQ